MVNNTNTNSWRRRCRRQPVQDAKCHGAGRERHRNPKCRQLLPLRHPPRRSRHHQEQQEQQQRSLPAGVMIAENPPAVQTAAAATASLQPHQPQQLEQQELEQPSSQQLQELYQVVMKHDQMMLNIQHQLDEAQQCSMHQEQILLQFAPQQQQQQQVPPPQQQQ
eukprot:scpid73787/ scgid14353/ 